MFSTHRTLAAAILLALAALVQLSPAVADATAPSNTVAGPIRCC